ncbi:hypothetical protein GCM10022233_42630 [Streptomyces shaanxiensis]|uniref:Replication initiation protein n=1 Tax=Streptomyces shaanxiensis TaxID=653357 RepID=A0ABP7VBY8_9ACTN
MRREVAKRAGLSQRRFREHWRVSFAKVAEYQKRGAVHVHAVIRIDGPSGVVRSEGHAVGTHQGRA